MPVSTPRRRLSAPGSRRRLRKAAVALTAVLALGAAACGGSSGDAAGTSSSPGASATPTRGGDLVIARTADSQSMNKTTVFQNESIWVFEQIYENLYTVTPDGKDVKPLLATSYTVSPDKLTYTFKLRQGVTFSSGKALTSADVKFSIDAATAGAAVVRPPPFNWRPPPPRRAGGTSTRRSRTRRPRPRTPSWWT